MVSCSHLISVVNLSVFKGSHFTSRINAAKAASAAFRAFRARSLEATLLLAAGCVVMLGQVPLGDELTGGLALRAQSFLMEVVNKAGVRALIIGATLGGLATGLRIVLGIERSYLSE